MMNFVKLDQLPMAAFIFMQREKDYGGVHLCIQKGALPSLQELVWELNIFPSGHSRRLSLRRVPPKLPEAIYRGAAYRHLTSLRLGTANITELTVSIEDERAVVLLADTSLNTLTIALNQLENRRGDICIAGDVAHWSDRIWLWLWE